ncbi:hypothetical protein C8R43DRAFT_1132804 [Mycena crocata]|nr:hypothetical protein C8R43DRAFT_1132804 [Mycena crocata]
MFHNASHAFAVYSGCPNLISRSSLIELEGRYEDTMGDEAKRGPAVDHAGGLGQAEVMLDRVRFKTLLSCEVRLRAGRGTCAIPLRLLCISRRDVPYFPREITLDVERSFDPDVDYFYRRRMAFKDVVRGPTSPIVGVAIAHRLDAPALSPMIGDFEGSRRRVISRSFGRDPALIRRHSSSGP